MGPAPHLRQGDAATFELVVAGRALSDSSDSEIAIMMVEAGGTAGSFEMYADGAPKVSEDVLSAGLEASKLWIREAINLQRELVKEFVAARGPDQDHRVQGDERLPGRRPGPRRSRRCQAPSLKRNSFTAKTARNEALDAATAQIIEQLSGEFPDRLSEIKAAVKSITKKLVRPPYRRRRRSHRRPWLTDIRALSAEVDVLPAGARLGAVRAWRNPDHGRHHAGHAAHGSRSTRSGPESPKRYMHHYNFPPFSTGETGRVGSPKRREIGHGALAERALMPVLPAARSSLRDPAGLRSPEFQRLHLDGLGLRLHSVAAQRRCAAQGAGRRYRDGPRLRRGRRRTHFVLTDILGAEDAFGDMDFKVAGTKDFVTALQLDTKLDGIPADVLAGALHQAKDARLRSSTS